MGKQVKNKRSSKAVLGFVSLFAAVAVIVGVGYAYFSDVIGGNGTATAGTLDIQGTLTLSQNGVSVVGQNIPNLNPGDMVTVSAGSVTNLGTKSAWIREIFQFNTISATNNDGDPSGPGAETGNLADWLWVCTGGTAPTQADLITAFAAAPRTVNGSGNNVADSPVSVTGGASCVPANTSTVFGEKGTYTVANDVIDGTLEAEAGSSGTTWSPAAGTTPTIFFDQLANNGAQNGNATFSASIQALQYRNNITSPTNTQWNTVVTTPFGL
jgi:hypothetical protein